MPSLIFTSTIISLKVFGLKPYKALEKLRQCAGIITPDFSTYQDDPEPIKLYNTYRMRAFGRWLTTLGFPVINNVRWGTKGFAEGLEEMIRRLTPKIILVYGSTPDKFFGKYREAGIQIREYPSRTNVAFEKRQRHE